MARILVIDDIPEIRELLKDGLGNAGHEVITASEGGEAIRQFRDNPCDLVITDLIMPGKEGIETIREFRQIDPGIKIIAISGGSSMAADNYLVLAKKLGADLTVQKPFSVRDMISRIEDLLGIADADA